MPGGGEKPGRREYKPRAHKYTTESAKSKIVELLQDGLTVQAACDKVGYSRKSYEAWRRLDKAFGAKCDQARQLRAKRDDIVRGERLGFAEWRQKYLGVSTPWHQLQWVDLLEGREPRDLHTSQTYEPNKRNRLLINCPPFHGKSVALTIHYTAYRLCMDPGFRVIIISAGSELAKDFLFGVKQILTNPDFIDLQRTYAPDGGWEATSESWTETRIVFGTAVRAQSTKAFHEKDANVLALGMRSKVYGRRADLIIVDDGVDTTNVSEHAKQLKWLRGMVESRLEAGGKLMVIGTRVSPIDLYSELRKPENYANGRVPWTYLASPAILEEGERPEEHKTLWPWADAPWVQPEDAEMDECLCENTPECSAGVLIDGAKKYARWDGIHLENGPRASNNNSEWALIFQQSSIADDATFPEHAVTRAVNGSRQAGLLKANTVGHPPLGMNGMYVVAGLDPAIKGFAGMVVIAVDRETKMRYLLNAWNMKAPTAAELKQKMREVTVEYRVNEWRVEKTGLLQFFTQDSELRLWMASAGVRFVEHLTGSNKNDAAYGVSSCGPLFGEYDKAWDDPNGQWRQITPPLIELPRAQNSDGLKALTHQLVTWTPELDPNKVPCDMVMALWFALVGAREHLGVGTTGNVTSLFGRSSRFQSPRSTASATRISLADYRRDSL